MGDIENKWDFKGMMMMVPQFVVTICKAMRKELEKLPVTSPAHSNIKAKSVTIEALVNGWLCGTWNPI